MAIGHTTLRPPTARPHCQLCDLVGRDPIRVVDPALCGAQEHQVTRLEAVFAEGLCDPGCSGNKTNYAAGAGSHWAVWTVWTIPTSTFDSLGERPCDIRKALRSGIMPVYKPRVHPDTP